MDRSKNTEDGVEKELLHTWRDRSRWTQGGLSRGKGWLEDGKGEGEGSGGKGREREKIVALWQGNRQIIYFKI